jgi:hypothetical protein
VVLERGRHTGERHLAPPCMDGEPSAEQLVVCPQGGGDPIDQVGGLACADVMCSTSTHPSRIRDFHSAADHQGFLLDRRFCWKVSTVPQSLTNPF